VQASARGGARSAPIQNALDRNLKTKALPLEQFRLDFLDGHNQEMAEQVVWQRMDRRPASFVSLCVIAPF